jgi:hypothetical protein
MLVLLMRVIVIYAIELASGGMVYIPSFVKIDIGVQAVTWFASAILEAVILVLLIGIL